jgi:hypothetical protein
VVLPYCRVGPCGPRRGETPPLQPVTGSRRCPRRWRSSVCGPNRAQSFFEAWTVAVLGADPLEVAAGLRGRGGAATPSLGCLASITRPQLISTSLPDRLRYPWPFAPAAPLCFVLRAACRRLPPALVRLLRRPHRQRPTPRLPSLQVHRFGEVVDNLAGSGASAQFRSIFGIPYKQGPSGPETVGGAV